MLTQQDQDHTHALARAARRPVARAAALAGRRRSVCAVLAVAAWAATSAAVIVGGQLGRGAAVQIVLAASMASAVLGETLLSPTWQATATDPGPSGAAGWYNRPGALAFIAVLLGPAVGGAALGAGWRTSLFTTIAVACAAAGIATHRLGRHLPGDANRIPEQAAPAAGPPLPNQPPGPGDVPQIPASDLASTRQFVTM